MNLLAQRIQGIRDQVHRGIFREGQLEVYYLVNRLLFGLSGMWSSLKIQGQEPLFLTVGEPF